MHNKSRHLTPWAAAHSADALSVMQDKEKLVEVSPIKSPMIFLGAWALAALIFSGFPLFALLQGSSPHELILILTFSLSLGSAVIAFNYLLRLRTIQFRIVFQKESIVVETITKTKVLKGSIEVKNIIEFRTIRNGVQRDGGIDTFPRYGVVAIKTKNYLLFGGCQKFEAIKISEELTEFYGIPSNDHGDQYLDHVEKWEVA